MNHIKRNKIQREAVDIWEKKNKKGSVIIATGVGKTFVALHCLYTMPLDYSVEHLFLAETTTRKQDLIQQIKQYNKIFNRDVIRDYNLKFKTYQAAYKLRGIKCGLVICDEIQDNLSPAYAKFHLYNKYDAVLGLSAYINEEITYELSNGKIVTKGDILNKVAPIIFTYGLQESLNNNTSRKLEVIVIKTELNKYDKTIKAGNKKVTFYQTEQQAYKYWDKRFNESLFLERKPKESIEAFEKRKDGIIMSCISKRKNLIYNSSSKINVVNRLLKVIKEKTIIFSNSLDTLKKVTPNVVSSKVSEDVNEALIEAFNKGELDTIGSFKKLKQGANLKELDVVILMSYYSSKLDYIQKVGRLRNNGEVGKVFILVTKETQEEAWFSKMLEDVNTSKFKVYESIEEFLKNN